MADDAGKTITTTVVDANGATQRQVPAPEPVAPTVLDANGASRKNVAAAKEAEVKETPAAAKETPAAPAAKEVKKVHLADDDDLPEGDIFEIPKEAFARRLKKAGKAETNKLLEKFGAKDVNELEGFINEARESRKLKEEQRIAQLSAEEKLKEEIAKAQTDRDTWRQKFEQSVNMRERSEQRSQLMKLGGKYVDEDYLEDQLPLLAKHLTTKYTDDELKDLPDSVIEDWFKARIEAKPKLAKDGPPPPPPEKRTLQTGAKDPAPPAGSGDKVEPPKGYGIKRDANGKNIETDQDRREARERLQRELGVSW